MDKKTQQVLIGAAMAGLMSAHVVSTDVFAKSAKKSGDMTCQGGNSCKGAGACKSASNSCKGQNACKGTGWTKEKNQKACDDKLAANASAAPATGEGHPAPAPAPTEEKKM